jgi:hypothetical protein
MAVSHWVRIFGELQVEPAAGRTRSPRVKVGHDHSDGGQARALTALTPWYDPRDWFVPAVTWPGCPRPRDRHTLREFR